MKFSVIIPALNEERNIARTLGALAAQTIGHDSFEVIVVDNGSTDRTLQEAGRSASTLRLRLISKPGGNIASVRNAGARIAAKGLCCPVRRVSRSTW